MNYLLPPSSPESLIRSLRQKFRARMLGVGLLAGGVALAPFVFGCSCPQRQVRYAHHLSPEVAAQAATLEDEEEACALLCGGNVVSCDTASLVPGAASAETRGRYDMHQPQREGEAPPAASSIVVCEVIETQSCGMGRPPEGLRQRVSLGRTRLGAYAAEAAHLEAASAVSFVQLATELEAHGAPLSLVHAAERSAADEVRHARAASLLASSLGAEVFAPVVVIPTPRPLREVLRENAAVGGVEEGFGAWVLQRQSQSALHSGVRRFVSTIAEDEQRHGALANVIDAWGAPGLTRGERARQVEAKVIAWDEQLARVQAPRAAGFAAALGLPSADEAAAWVLRARVADAQAA